MGINIQFSQSYHWLNSWILANIIQLATQDFCERFVEYSNSYLHDAAKHILAQKNKFNQWLGNGNPEIAANALLVLCLRENRMLQSQIQSQLESFKQTGGFTENMTNERLEARKAKAATDGAPLCPKCGKPMFKRMQKKGQMQGREFWGCSNYPQCNGTLPIKHS